VAADTGAGSHERQKSLVEWEARSASVDTAYCQVDEPGDAGGGAPSAGALTPVWLAGELFLVRRVSLDGRDVVQGAWLDREELERWLPTTVADLLPSARVEPLLDPAISQPHRLAALPLVVVPGRVDVGLEGGRTVGLPLAVAWGGLLLAAVAVIALVAGALSLSERRATFVSAVTHELRTPLTTLQTYSEMLANGQIAEAEKRQRYLETLHREALRLSHLVGNVLAYSGIERGRTAGPFGPLEVSALFERLAERLASRAAQDGAGLALRPPARPLSLVGDPAAIEQVLFNLVDNACKYAGPGARVEVSAAPAGPRVEIHVRDSGPGVPDEVRRRLFEPFSKSAQQAAGTAPGVGLGLALSRRLARAMHGDLRLDADGPGARFVLSLPADGS
jgi:signal transduction histidine kinase